MFCFKLKLLNKNTYICHINTSPCCEPSGIEIFFMTSHDAHRIGCDQSTFCSSGVTVTVQMQFQNLLHQHTNKHHTAVIEYDDSFIKTQNINFAPHVCV